MAKILKVLLDPGHGRKTPGKRSPVWPNGKQLFEWDYNRQLTAKIAEECKKHPELQPIILVTNDEDVGLTKRARLANAYGYSKTIFLSIHGNAAANESAAGWEIHTSPGQTKADDLATCIWTSVKEFMQPAVKMRGDWSDNDPDWESKFTVLMKTTMPAVLLENGFFTNYNECMNMLDQEWQKKLAQAIVNGIMLYYKNFYNK